MLLLLLLSPAWLDVPYVQQSRFGCGPAAISMVIQYWARQDPALNAAARDIDASLPGNGSLGVEGKALKRYLEARGFQAFVFNGEMTELEHHFARGRPVVVCFAPRGARGPWHYAVVVGIGKDEVRLNDPARGKLVRERVDAFRDAWKVTGNWALLAVPRSSSP